MMASIIHPNAVSLQLKVPLRSTNVYCILERILSFNGLLIHEGFWIYEVLVGFKLTPTKRSAKCNRFAVVKS